VYQQAHYYILNISLDGNLSRFNLLTERYELWIGSAINEIAPRE
jgi:hypothetical protein